MKVFAVLAAVAGVAMSQAVTTLPDGQPQAPSSAAVITSISDHQPQAPSSAALITSISDHQPQAPSAPALITSISDHQPQAPSGTGYVPAPAPTPTYVSGAGQKVVGGAFAGVAAIAGLILA